MAVLYFFFSEDHAIEEAVNSVRLSATGLRVEESGWSSLSFV